MSETYRVSAQAQQCIEKARLREELGQALSTIIVLTNREVQAVLDWKLDELKTVESDLRRLRQLKEDLMHAYKTHVESHGC
jgi:hypothetical protein